MRAAIYFSLLLLVMSLGACNKKKSDPEPEPTPTPSVPVTDISLKQDGTELKCEACGFSYQSGGLWGLSFNLPSVSEPMLVNFYFAPAKGVYNLVSEGDDGNVTFSMKRNGVFYESKIGTIEVTEVDTAQSGLINKMKATFSFVTDTISGKSFKVTDGIINFAD